MRNIFKTITDDDITYWTGQMIKNQYLLDLVNRELLYVGIIDKDVWLEEIRGMLASIERLREADKQLRYNQQRGPWRVFFKAGAFPNA